jgi:GT2 family glycosyltransferase
MKAIITVALYNALPYTIWMLESLYKNTDSGFEVVLVNNGSNDGTKQYIEWFKDNYPGVHCVHLPQNLGFSLGHNAAFKYIKDNNLQYDFICLLNNDVLVSRQWITSMERVSMMDKDIGIVAPVSNNAGGTQQVNVTANWTDLEEFTIASNEYRKKMNGQMTREGVVVGLCMLITKKCFLDCLPFPENHPMTMFDDNLLCLKALHKGYKLVVDRSTIIWHYGQRSFKANQIDMNKKMKEMNEVFKLAWAEEEAKL